MPERIVSLFRPRYADGQRLQIAGAPVRLRISVRARRVSLKVDPVRREIVATAPSARRLAEAAEFARHRGQWVADRLAELPAPTALDPAAPVAVFGAPCRLQPDGRRPKLLWAPGRMEAVLTGCGAGVVDPQLAARAIKREALAVFTARARIHCAHLGVETPPLSLIDARTRWGSCSPGIAGRGPTIRLSWRLALAPFPVADYVVAHECAHLIEANHGPRFWVLVRRLVGDPRTHRAWLRAKGATLHGFGATIL